LKVVDCGHVLPYVYLDSPDQKLKWNVYSFDEGMASRVPYEAAARVLPQTKRSFAGYVVRQGLAIAMEHNFMMSQKGQENFKNQLLQLVGSIQMTNDLDVHIALLTAPSYQRQQNEKFIDTQQTLAKLARRYVDMFGIMQKIPNALDFLIEDAKQILKTWGSQPPTFCLCNGKLQTQLTMLPERTNYITNGPDGAQRLAQGPELPSYRGLQFINTRKFSMEAGTAPRDLLRRRVRVAEFYVMQPGYQTMEIYDQNEDSMAQITKTECRSHALDLSDPLEFDRHVKPILQDMQNNEQTLDAHGWDAIDREALQGYLDPNAVDPDAARTTLQNRMAVHGVWWTTDPTPSDNVVAEVTNMLQAIGDPNVNALTAQITQLQNDLAAERAAANDMARVADLRNRLQALMIQARMLARINEPGNIQRMRAAIAHIQNGADTFALLLRPNIEHEMLGIIMGRGGTQELGCTFWGQTEMSCYDDAQHGIWGMSYKYHERAIVTNERNLIRVYDIAFDGYNGGMDKSMLNMNDEDDVPKFRQDTMNKSVAYAGTSIVPFVLPCTGRKAELKSPLLFAPTASGLDETENRENVRADDLDKHYIVTCLPHWTQKLAWMVQWKHLGVTHWIAPTARNTLPGDECIAGTSAQVCMAFQGTMKLSAGANNVQYPPTVNHGSGHLGPSYCGVASVREGRGRMYIETVSKETSLTHVV
jgi:hypothetical protein